MTKGNSAFSRHLPLRYLSRPAEPRVQPAAQTGESPTAQKAGPSISWSVSDRGRVSQWVRGRDRRVDFFRGLALVMIFIDHVPGNLLSSFTLWNFGLCDAAEVFVLLAGISASLVFGTLYERTYWPAATARVLMRCGELYIVHVVLFCIVAAVVVSATRYFDNPFYLEQVNLLPLFVDTERALVYALTLGYQPDFLDILPLYVVLLAFVPVSVPWPHPGVRSPGWSRWSPFPGRGCRRSARATSRYFDSSTSWRWPASRRY
jgi:OpgC protein